MPQVKVTTDEGEQISVSCPNVDPSVIDKEFIAQRTRYNVESIEVKLSVEERLDRLEK